MCEIKILGSLVELRLATFLNWCIQSYHIYSNARWGFSFKFGA